VICPIALVVPRSRNHTFPSDPATRFSGTLPAFRPWLDPYSVIAPDGVIRPIAFVVPSSLNHRFPSDPKAMSPNSMLPGFRPLAVPYSVTAPDGVIRPIA
jgi:hypothetical protein